MLDVDHITVRYDSLVALKDVSLTVEKGSIHGVIGPNGAGKSTLMDAICGSRRVGSGRIRFRGADVTGASVGRRRRQGMSRSFQRTSIFPGLSVREQMELAASRFPRATIDDVVAALGLGPLLDQTASAIAYGDQRRVDVGLALLGNSKLILLDEPAAGLSTAETKVLFDHVTDLVRERGMTAIVVEHDVDAVFACCDTVTVLDLGQVLLTGPPAEVRADAKVIEAYLGTAA